MLGGWSFETLLLLKKHTTNKTKKMTGITECRDFISYSPQYIAW